MELNTALILGGGKGRRIGFDKKQLVVNGSPLIDKLINALRTQFTSIIVSSNDDFSRDNVITVKDRLGEGPLAGIYSALPVCQSDYLYVTACDMPNISLEYIQKLKAIALESTADVILTEREDGFLEPFNAFYNKNIIDKVKASLINKEYKMALLFNKLHIQKIKLENEDLFFNINYLDDLAIASGKSC